MCRCLCWVLFRFFLFNLSCFFLLFCLLVHSLSASHSPHCRHDNAQACQNGNSQHLEHLLFYGADSSSQNASGNTALHICALYNKESCARILLYRGASKDMKNNSGQTPFQVAVMSGHFELGEIIKNHRDTDKDSHVIIYLMILMNCSSHF
ncbi:hypothetical protein ILYODFUR_016243 [Ilyodon furcidens]|uniref:Uncharacterized protein n=1 Tax=Ilyodon furcidens TaxID=33524 RepID=A0ABV0T8E1_9TELE